MVARLDTRPESEFSWKNTARFRTPSIISGRKRVITVEKGYLYIPNSTLKLWKVPNCFRSFYLDCFPKSFFDRSGSYMVPSTALSAGFFKWALESESKSKIF